MARPSAGTAIPRTTGLNQIIDGTIIDQAGRPVCSEMWSGDVVNVTTLIPVTDRLRSRFGVGWVCVAADRGMISAAKRGLEYILSVRKGTSKEVREVMANQRLFRTAGDLACRPARQRSWKLKR